MEVGERDEMEGVGHIPRFLAHLTQGMMEPLPGTGKTLEEYKVWGKSQIQSGWGPSQSRCQVVRGHQDWELREQSGLILWISESLMPWV